MAAEDPQILRIELTPEELLVLFELAVDSPEEVPTDDIVPDYSEEKLAFGREFARRTLVARGMIAPDEDGEGFTLNPLAINLVGVSLDPDEKTYLMAQDKQGATRQVEFSRYGDEVYLAYAETPTGLHEFEFLVDAEAYSRRMIAALGLNGADASDAPEAEVPSSLIFRALRLSREGDGDGAVETLEGSSLPQETKDALASALKSSFEIKRVTVSRRDEGELGEIVFLQADGALWHFGRGSESDEGEERTVRLEAASADEIAERVRELHASS